MHSSHRAEVASGWHYSVTKDVTRSPRSVIGYGLMWGWPRRARRSEARMPMLAEVIDAVGGGDTHRDTHALN